MGAKHTPGPWKVRKGFSSGEYEVYPTRPGEKPGFKGARWADVATVSEASRGESARANARLIAAAPELLDALECIKSAWEAHDDTPKATKVLLDEVQASFSLIAKAKGE